MFEEFKNANQKGGKNFSAAPGLRLYSRIIDISTGVLLILSIIAAFVLFCLKDLWWIGLVVIAGALVFFFIQSLVSLLIFGFAEIIDNTKNEAKDKGGKVASPCSNKDSKETLDDVDEADNVEKSKKRSFSIEEWVGIGFLCVLVFFIIMVIVFG